VDEENDLYFDVGRFLAVICLRRRPERHANERRRKRQTGYSLDDRNSAFETLGARRVCAKRSKVENIGRALSFV